MTGHIVIDDVLPSEEFTQIKEAIMHDQFDWQFRKGISCLLYTSDAADE